MFIVKCNEYKNRMTYRFIYMYIECIKEEDFAQKLHRI